MNTLYIFATSERPDPYINVLAYTIAHLQISSIFVIVISEHDYAEEAREDKVLASTVVANISEQLRALAGGQYLEFSNEQHKRRVVPLEGASGVGIYQRCLETMNQSGTTGIVIPLASLDNSLRKFVAKGKCIFDVSALKKNLLVDVVATLLSIGYSDVYSFELVKKPTYSQLDLYHNLKHNEDFLFRNLATSAPVRLSLQRIKKWSARSQAIILFTLVLAGVFIPLSFWWKESQLLVALNIAAMAASIGSYLFLLVRDR
jgi:hypothetical protein